MRSFVIAVGLLITALAAAGFSAAQTTQSGQSAGVPPAKALANSWMLVPTSYTARSADIASSVRAARDESFDTVIGAGKPITRGIGGHYLAAEGWSSRDPEIPKVPNRAVLTATFKSYRSILSASERCIYTEVTFHVDTIFQVEAGGARPGGDITVGLPGGTVMTSSGKVVSDLTQPREYWVEPGRKYLLVLSYRASGDFYGLAEDWDISDGKVRENTGRARSSLDGLSVDQLAPAVYTLLASETH